jgi:hypothetical protein
MLHDRLSLDPYEPARRNHLWYDDAIADLLYDHQEEALTLDFPAVRWLMEQQQFGVVAARDGLLHLKRQPPDDQKLVNEVSVHHAPTTSLTAAFDGLITLVRAEVQPVGGRRFLVRGE